MRTGTLYARSWKCRYCVPGQTSSLRALTGRQNNTKKIVALHLAISCQNKHGSLPDYKEIVEKRQTKLHKGTAWISAKLTGQALIRGERIYRIQCEWYVEERSSAFKRYATNKHLWLNHPKTWQFKYLGHWHCCLKKKWNVTGFPTMQKSNNSQYVRLDIR